MPAYDGYTVHLVLPEGRSIIVCGDDYDAALSEYHAARQTALRECTIADHPDGNGFWAMNRVDTSKTYNVRFLKDYDEAYEHALAFFGYDAVEMYDAIDEHYLLHTPMYRDAIEKAVDSGCFLVYDDDIADFLVDYDGHETHDAGRNMERYKKILCDALAT
jgi:hypothetical protein